MSMVRCGLTLIEVLVAMAVVAMLAALLLPAVQSAREAARKAQCANNLRQLGVGFISYHDAWRVFPVSSYGPWPQYAGTAADPWSNPTFYTSLLRYVEQDSQTPAEPRPISLFLCPTRRGPAAGPKDDFAGARHPDEFFQNGWQSVLGGPYLDSSGEVRLRGGVGLSWVAGLDGSSNTLLLAHKAMRPSYYYGPWGPGLATGDNGGWAGPSDNFEHARDPRSFIQDVESPGVELYIGSPHPGAMPSLLADGSVRALSYATASEVIPRLWAWNDGGFVSADAY
jgi:prepilin-type N-terminal cleavage/methylation domain-containing protein